MYPRISVSHTQFRDNAHELSGTLAGAPASVPIEEIKIGSGMAEAAVEVTRGYRAGGAVWYPFAEIGVRYAFDRPNDGRILSGSLTLEETSPWSGLVRAGVRTLVTKQMFLEAGVGYLSLGQKDLDVVEGRVFLSIAF